jgi:putative transposase
VHKRRNVLEHLPDAMRPRVKKAIDEAYGLADAELATRRLEQLAAGLHRTHPGAAASLREGLDETLTLQRLGVSGALYRTLRSTDESQLAVEPEKRSASKVGGVTRGAQSRAAGAGWLTLRTAACGSWLRGPRRGRSWRPRAVVA